LSLDELSELEVWQNVFVAGSLSRTPLGGAYIAPPDPLAGCARGTWLPGEGKGVEGIKVRAKEGDGKGRGCVLLKI